MPITRIVLSVGLMLIAPVCITQEGKSTTQGEGGEAGLEVLDEVLITGTQPGPALWQVKSGTNVLWVLPVASRLSKGVKWKSKQVEKVMASTQEVLVVYGTETLRSPTREEISIRAALLKQASYLPEGQTLREILPDEMYERFESVRTAFPGRNKTEEMDIEKSRPDRVRMLLTNRALQALKLGVSPVTDKVIDMAKRKNTKLTRVGYGYAKGGLVPVQSLEVAMDICPLDEVLRNLENNGARWKARANAWAVGDVKRLKALLLPASSIPECKSVGAPEARAGAVWLSAKQTWLMDMERALARSTSALAVIDASLFLSMDGVASDLRTRGYEVVEP